MENSGTVLYGSGMLYNGNKSDQVVNCEFPSPTYQYLYWPSPFLRETLDNYFKNSIKEHILAAELPR